MSTDSKCSNCDFLGKLRIDILVQSSQEVKAYARNKVDEVTWEERETICKKYDSLVDQVVLHIKACRSRGHSDKVSE